MSESIICSIAVLLSAMLVLRSATMSRMTSWYHVVIPSKLRGLVPFLWGRETVHTDNLFLDIVGELNNIVIRDHNDDSKALCIISSSFL